MSVARGAVRWLTFVAAMAMVASVFAATSGSAGSAPPTGPLAQLETNISNNTSETMGEPQIAANPTNRDNLFIDWTTFSDPPGNPVPEQFPCGGMASMDGGLTWHPAPVPLHLCADAVATFGPDGTLYAGGIVIDSSSTHPPPCNPGEIQQGNNCILVTGHDAVLRSTDSGQTWSAPVAFMGSESSGPFPFAPGSGHPVNTFDRPWVSVDSSTGVVYASAQNLLDHERFVTASTDGGQSFGTIYAADSPKYPGGSGGTIAAARGVLAVRTPRRRVQERRVRASSSRPASTTAPPSRGTSCRSSTPRPARSSPPTPPGQATSR
jgi:hypothetical protein